MLEVGRNCWQAKLPVEENAEYVVAEYVVFIAVWETVEWQASEQAEE
jgi:hypothetical protein